MRFLLLLLRFKPTKIYEGSAENECAQNHFQLAEHSRIITVVSFGRNSNHYKRQRSKQTRQPNIMDAVQEKLQLLRAQLDQIPVLQQAEVGTHLNEFSLQ